MWRTMGMDASFSEVPSIRNKNSSKSHFVMIFFILLLVVILILVGLYFLGASKQGTSQSGSKQQPTAAPTQAQSSTPTPTPTVVSLKREDLEIAVLNGSGVAGSAKGISTYLEDLGYTIKTVGNAKKFDYKGVTVLISKEKNAYLDQLKKDLAAKSASLSASVDDSLTTDAEVIVGK